jgi:DNA mismatch repair protein MSH2
VKIYYFIKSLDNLYEEIAQYEGIHQETIQRKFLLPLESIIGNFESILVPIEKMIDLPKVESRNEYLIRAEFDKELAAVSEEREEIYKEINNMQLVVAEELSCEVFREDTQDSIIFSIPKKNLNSLEGSKIKQGSVVKNKVHIHHKGLEELVVKYIELREIYELRQNHLVEKLNKLLCTYLVLFDELSDLIVHLDILSSFATASVSATIPYTRPEIKESNADEILLKGCRHPCLEVQEGISFIPNDIEMNRKNQCFYIITG